MDSARKNDDNHCPQMFLKECNYTEKIVIKHINDNLSDVSSSPDESNEEKIRIS